MSAPTRQRRTLRLCTAGSVDDGKSTFVGRLLYDTKNILADQYEAVVASSHARGQENPDLSLLVDGLRAEREQGITIDVAYRYFATDVRSFILADCPGHEQYTRNTVTGMSTAEAVVLLVDARNGVVTQTRRHATVAALLGVRHVIFAVNKIDLLDYNEQAFRAIEADLQELARRLHLKNTVIVPVSALVGDNIVEHSDNTPWYHGESVLELLENLDIAADEERDASKYPLRLPIDYVIRDHASEFRGYAGRIATGKVALGDTVALPGGRSAAVERITVAGEDVTSAVAGQSVAVCLDDHIDLARGDLISDQPVTTKRRFSALAVHLSDKPLTTRKVVEVRYGAALVRGRIASIDALIDIDTSQPTSASDHLEVNDVAEVTVELAQELPVEPYRVGGRVGAFLLIEPGTGDTLTAGLVR